MKKIFLLLIFNNQKISIKIFNNKTEILTYTIKISQNIELFIKIIKIIFEKLYEKLKKNLKIIEKNYVFINSFKYINNQHNNNKITPTSKLSD